MRNIELWDGRLPGGDFAKLGCLVNNYKEPQVIASNLLVCLFDGSSF